MTVIEVTSSSENNNKATRVTTNQVRVSLIQEIGTKMESMISVFVINIVDNKTEILVRQHQGKQTAISTIDSFWSTTSFRDIIIGELIWAIILEWSFSTLDPRALLQDILIRVKSLEEDSCHVTWMRSKRVIKRLASLPTGMTMASTPLIMLSWKQNSEFWFADWPTSVEFCLPWIIGWKYVILDRGSTLPSRMAWSSSCLSTSTMRGRLSSFDLGLSLRLQNNQILRLDSTEACNC